MRCKYLRSCAFWTAAAVVWVSVAAAGDNGPSDTTAFSKATQVKESTDVGAKPKGGVPTPAKRKPGEVVTPIEIEPVGQSAPQSEQAAKQSKPDAKIVDEPLRPIPDAMESGPVSIEAASFKGVTPGVSTKEDVEKAWGKPKKSFQQNDSSAQLYSVEPFNRVEVNYSGKKVSSVVIRFDRAFPADGVAKQLDLATVRPVLVYSEVGEVLGLAYPERGVLFAFEAGKASQEKASPQEKPAIPEKPATPEKAAMKVAQLVLEPITAEPFVLRAETTLESRCDLSRRDLEQALALEPDNARAHWLLGRVLAAMEQYEQAATVVGAAVRLEPDNPNYRVTRAQVLAQTGRLAEALADAQKAAAASGKRPHVRARALCLVGDLTASGPKPDFKKAISFHTQALQIADPLCSDQHPAIRLAAKEVLIDAHLGAAHDIAWGDWQQKNKAVARWLERAAAVADDLVRNEGGSREQVLRVQVRAMAAYVGVRGGIDPGPAVKVIVSTGDELIAAAHDPAHKAQLQRDVGLALYDAVQICQMRSDAENAMKHGRLAAEYLTKADQLGQSPSNTFLLGRLYFRLGAIEAAGDKNHRAAVGWFDKAVPLLEGPPPEELAADLGRHGEAFVSMGVSYWETGQQQKAVSLTEKGVKWMEQAVNRGTLDLAALNVPHNNLAAMHRKLGSTDVAEKLQETAERAKKDKVK